MGEAYPELNERGATIERALKAEEERFAETLDAGMLQFEARMQQAGGKTVPGALVFQLYDTYGFPLDLTADIARERGLTVDQAGYETEMEAQRERARAASHFGVDLARRAARRAQRIQRLRHARRARATSSHCCATARAVPALATGEDGEVVLDRTPFYAESGGQVGDTGVLESVRGVRFDVSDTHKRGQAFAHFGQLESGSLQLGDVVDARVDAPRRAAIRLNHSATHLLHAALRQVLGTHVTQKGSLVAPERLRFDFSHPQG